MFEQTNQSLWTALALVLLLPLSAWSADVAVSVNSNGVAATAKGSNNGVVVRVVGAGGAVNFTAASKGNASFNLSDIAGDGALLDGLYKYEACASPRGVTNVFDRDSGRGAAEIEAYLKGGNNLVESAEEAAGLPSGSECASGAFTVSNGSIVDSNAEESSSEE